MGLFKNYKRQAAWTRKQEESVYDFIAEEMDKGIIRKGLMTKALSETEGNQERAKGAYIKLRFQSIKDEFIIYEEFLEAIESKHDNRQKESIGSEKKEFHDTSAKPNKAEIINSNIGRHKLWSEGHYIEYIVYAGSSVAIMELSDKSLKKYIGKSFKSVSEFEEFIQKIFGEDTEFYGKGQKKLIPNHFLKSNIGRHTYNYSEEHYVNYIIYAGSSAAIMELSDKSLKKYIGKSFKSVSEFEEFVKKELLLE